MRYLAMGILILGLAEAACAQGPGRGVAARGPQGARADRAQRSMERGMQRANYRAMVEKAQRRRLQRLAPTQPLTRDDRFGHAMRERSRFEARRGAAESANAVGRPAHAGAVGQAASESMPDRELQRAQFHSAQQAGQLAARRNHFAERLAQIDRLRDRALESGNTDLLQQADRMEQQLRHRQQLIEQQMLARPDVPEEAAALPQPDRPAAVPPARRLAQRRPEIAGEPTPDPSPVRQRFGLLRWFRALGKTPDQEPAESGREFQR